VIINSVEGMGIHESRDCHKIQIVLWYS